MFLRPAMERSADEGRFRSADGDAMKDADLSVMFSPGPALVAEHGFTTGKVGLASFEKVLSPSSERIGRAGNFGCDAVAFTEERKGPGAIPTNSAMRSPPPII